MWHTKEEPFLGLQGMGGGASSLMWVSSGSTKYNLFTWGSNSYGELGLNQGWRWPNGLPTMVARSSPTQIPGDWYAIYGGNAYEKRWQMGAKDEEDTLWTWGSNTYGQLGHNECDDDPHRANKSSPTQIPGSWTFAGASAESVLGLKDDGTLWGWGIGTNGIWGGGHPQPTVYASSSPNQLGSHFEQAGRNWVADTKKWSINRNTYFLINDLDELWAWGNNTQGGLGQNETFNQNYSSPVQIPGSWYSVDCHSRYNSVAAIRTDGNLYYWGSYAQYIPWPTSAQARSSPTLMPGGPYIRSSTKTGLSGNMIVRNPTAGVAGSPTSTLWFMGQAEYGLKGNNDTAGSAPNGYGTISSPIQVGGPTSTGWSRYVEVNQFNSACALKYDGTLWTWGSNQYGALGHSQAGSPTQPWFPGASREDYSRSSPTQLPGTWGNASGDDTKEYIIKRRNGFSVLQKQ